MPLRPEPTRRRAVQSGFIGTFGHVDRHVVVGRLTVDHVTDLDVAALELAGGGIDEPVSLGAAVAWSALTLLSGAETRRLRICGNCGWLFVDRSRNGSRVWCDMAVCGNRRKAQRHYHRSREAREKRHG